MRSKEEIFNGMHEVDFLARGYSDFRFFSENVFGLQLEDKQAELVNLIDKEDRVAVMAFTGGGKTFLLGELYPLWKMFYNPGFSTLVVSSHMDQSTKLLRRVKDRIFDNELMVALVPKVRTKWSETEIVTTNRCNMFCKPLTLNVSGVHVNYLLADEVAKYQDKQLFYSEVLTRATAKDDTKISCISTPIAENDLIHEVLANNEFKAVILKAEDPIGTPTMPNRFGMEKLNQIKSMLGTAVYARMFLCDCTSVGDRSVYDIGKLVDSFDKELDFTEKIATRGIRYIGGDLAMSPRGDYSVFIVIELTGWKITIKEMIRLRGVSFGDQELELERLTRVFHPAAIILDSTNIGHLMFTNLLAKGLPIYGQGFTPSERHDILNNLRRVVQDGRFRIPRHPNAEPLTDVLFNEIASVIETKTPSGMKTYKALSAHDDALISLALACRFITHDKKEQSEGDDAICTPESNSQISGDDMWVI